MEQAFHAEFADTGILKIVFDTPNSRVNIFNETTGSQLNQLIEELKADPSIKAAFLMSGKGENFIAGADISGIQGISSPEDAYDKSRLGQQLFEKWRELRFPTLAAINGACVGGGLEWALAFSYRMATRNKITRLGLPEVKLGIIPGWGGTVRLPRLIGMKNSLKLILTGQLIDAEKAYKQCLIDEIVSPAVLEQSALTFLKTILRDGDRTILQRRRKNPARNGFLEKTRLGRSQVRKRAEKDVLKKSQGRYPAPLEALKSASFALDNNLHDALIFEAKKFADLAATTTCKNLIRVYQLTDFVKQGNATDGDIDSVNKIGIVGAGTMGTAIAEQAAKHGHVVRLRDESEAAVLRAFQQISHHLQQRVEKGRISKREAEDCIDQVSFTLDYSGFAKVDLAIETVPEEPILKSEILRKLDKCAQPNAILATNTQSLSVSELAAATGRPAQVVGFHFLNPFLKMPLVEIVRGKETSSETISVVYQLAKRWGRFPIIVEDRPGFLLNRLLSVYWREALEMMATGVPIENIEDAMQDFGMGIRLLELLDRIGFQTAEQIMSTVAASLGDRFPASSVLNTLLESGRERGFYPAKNGRKGAGSQRKIYKTLGVKPRRKVVDEEIQDRLIYAMINEAAYCLEEGIVQAPEAIDVAAVFGLGFPPFRGGLLHFADDRGADRIINRLRYFTNAFGEHFSPAPLLSDLATQKSTFYEYWIKSSRLKEDASPQE